jgi:hypothetical protein
VLILIFTAVLSLGLCCAQCFGLCQEYTFIFWYGIVHDNEGIYRQDVQKPVSVHYILCKNSSPS